MMMMIKLFRVKGLFFMMMTMIKLFKVKGLFLISWYETLDIVC